MTPTHPPYSILNLIKSIILTIKTTNNKMNEALNLIGISIIRKATQPI